MSRKRAGPIDTVRVIGIFAHVDAGKTTTSESILYHTGRIHRVGSVDEGSTQLDWMEQERERGITITAAATTCQWRDHLINLIDTPGHIDFTAEVVRSMRIIDGAVIVLCGVGGVETQTETVWMHADRQNLPRIIFVNKLDRPDADFDRVLDDVRERLTPRALPLQLPIRDADTLTGVVDLLDQRALFWQDGNRRSDGKSAGEMSVEPIPPSMEVKAAAARSALVDAICETDDVLLELHLEGLDLDVEALSAALRRATVSGELVPLLCGAARVRIGVPSLLDAVVAYLPAPVDVPPVVGVVPGTENSVERPSDLNAPLCAAAFKIVTDPHVGHLTWVRAFSGHLKTGETLYNPRADAHERVARIYRIHANRREQVDDMVPGDVMALVGVKSAITGDTLCDPAHPIALADFVFPDPVISVALTPVSEDRQGRLRQCLTRLCSEDPTLANHFDAETGEEILAGMGELHLEVTVDRLRTEFGIIARASPPRVSYRETVRKTATATGAYQLQTGGHGHFASVRLRVEPMERGEGVVFESVAPASEVPTSFVRPAELGLRDALAKGVIAGYPFTDVRVTLLGGKFHEVDSASMDFQIAASMAVRQAVRRGHAALLEPVMRAGIQVSEDYLGPVIADIGRRRGSVQEIQVRGRMRYIVVEVPLAEAQGYATGLRSLTRGRGTFTLEFLQYELVPDSLAQQIIERRRAEGKIPRR